MRMERRVFLGLGAGVAFLPGPVFEEPADDRPLWFTIRGTGLEEPIAIGAWGRAATFSVGELLKAVLREFGTDDPADTEVRIAHETEAEIGVIQADASVLMARKGHVDRLGGSRWGWVLIPDDGTRESDLPRMRERIDGRTSWAVLGTDPLSTVPCRFDRFPALGCGWPCSTSFVVHLLRHQRIGDILRSVYPGTWISGASPCGIPKWVLVDHCEAEYQNELLEESPGLKAMLVHLVHGEHFRDRVHEYVARARGHQGAAVPVRVEATMDPEAGPEEEMIKKLMLWIHAV